MHKTTRSHILPVAFATVVSMAAFVSVLVFIDPFSTKYLPQIFFYTTLFLSVFGLFTVLGATVRQRFFTGIFSDQFRTSMRQATLLALMTCGLIALQSYNLLFWWVGATLVMFIIMVEIFFNA